MTRRDAQWWAGAIGAGGAAAAAFIFGTHPWDLILGCPAAFLVAFSMYNVQPAGSRPANEVERVG